MATATFDKNIIIDNEAANRLVEILSKPVPPRPELENKYKRKSEKEIDEWSSRL